MSTVVRAMEESSIAAASGARGEAIGERGAHNKRQQVEWSNVDREGAREREHQVMNPARYATSSTTTTRLGLSYKRSQAAVLPSSSLTTTGSLVLTGVFSRLDFHVSTTLCSCIHAK